MKYLRKSSLCTVCSFLAAMMLIVTSSPVPLFAQDSASSGVVQSATKIKHDPIKYFVSGKRIRISADVTDPEGINLVRCYFKGKEQADFVFVTMTPGSSTYTAILPAAAKNATSIEYLFLAVDNKNQVVKTQSFSVNIDASQPAPPWQDVAMEGQLKVGTELAQTPAALEGFTDAIAMDVVESAARFGFVAGIYATVQVAAAGGATGAAATAVGAGTVTTGATGLSGGAIAAIAVGSVAVAAGAGYAVDQGIKNSSSTTATSLCTKTSKSGSTSTGYVIDLYKTSGTFQFDSMVNFGGGSSSAQFDIYCDSGSALQKTIACASTGVYKYTAVPYSCPTTKISVSVTADCQMLGGAQSWQYDVNCP